MSELSLGSASRDDGCFVSYISNKQLLLSINSSDSLENDNNWPIWAGLMVQVADISIVSLA